MNPAFIGLYTHKHGADVDLYFSEQDAWHGLAQVAFQNLEDVADDQRQGVARDMAFQYRRSEFQKVCALFMEVTDQTLEVRQVDQDNSRKFLAPFTESQLQEFIG